MASIQETRTSDHSPSGLYSGISSLAVTVCGCIVEFAYSAYSNYHAQLATALMREFGFNQALAGFLTTGIFATHAAMQVPGGSLVDRFGAKRMLFAALMWISVGNIAIAFASSYWQLLACKIFTGMGT